MSNSFQDSVVLITSKDPNEKAFGTGFVVAQDKQSTYFLTCAHVVQDVGGSEQVEIRDTPEIVTVDCFDKDIDLAVLHVGKRLNMLPFSLSVAGKKGKPFNTDGFQLEGHGHTIRPLTGALGARVGIQVKDRIRAWDLEITGTHLLQPGYSGSPVIDKYGRVIGVVKTRQGEGKTGVAISIEALRDCPNQTI